MRVLVPVLMMVVGMGRSLAAQDSRDDQIRDVNLADGLFPRPPERLLGLGIPFLDDAINVNADDRVESGLDD